MTHMLLTTCGILLLLGSAPTSAMAQVPDSTPPTAAVVSPNLARRADDVVRLINGEVDPTAVLAPSFLARAPADRVVQLAGAVRERYGRALTISGIDVLDPGQANIHISFERGQLTALLQVESDDEAKIEGLLFERPDRAQRGR